MITQSMETKNLLINLLNAKKEFTSIQQSKYNAYHKNRYSSDTDIINAIKEGLEKHNLILMQSADKESIHTRILHTQSGEWIETTFPMYPNIEKETQNDDKKTPKQINNNQDMISSIKYIMRSAIIKMLQLEIANENDKDIKAELPVERINKPAPTQQTNNTQSNAKSLDELKKILHCEVINGIMYLSDSEHAKTITYKDHIKKYGFNFDGNKKAWYKKISITPPFQTGLVGDDKISNG